MPYEIISSSANGLYHEYREMPDIDPMCDVNHLIDTVIHDYYSVNSNKKKEDFIELINERLTEYFNSLNNSINQLEDYDCIEF